MVKRAVMAMLLLAAATARADSRAVFSALPGGVVGVAFQSSILDESAIRKQLDGGLTTVFLIVVKERGTKNTSAARLEIRYDLWDEVWLVRRVDFDRRGEQQRIASFEALAKWWRITTRVFATSAGRAALDIEMRVLPFSAAEEKDARDWISKSGGVATASGGGGLVDALIGTTIAARPITTYRWSIDLLMK
jgi:hypothetical protein